MKKILIFLLTFNIISADPKKVIINVDPGGDDAISLMLALKDKSLNVLAITTTYGNVDIQNSTSNTFYVLKKIGVTNVPIYSGADKPLNRKHVKDSFWGEYGLGGISRTENVILSNDAVEKILDLIPDNNEEVTIIALGPLTNIAQAIMKDKKRMSHVQEIVTFGGGIKKTGNITPHAEFNIYLDPEAAEIVFDSGIPIKLITLDTTEELGFTWGNLLKILNDPLKDFLEKMLDTPKKDKMLVDYLCDPIAIYVATHEHQTNNVKIKVKKDGDDLGKTMIDHLAAKHNVQIVEKINKDSFGQYIKEILA